MCCLTGFRPGRCTLQAVMDLLNDIEDALGWSKGKLYTVFIDYTKPFDLVDRVMIKRKLDTICDCSQVKKSIIKSILTVNYVRISNSLSMSNEMRQTKSVIRGNT
jgi:hypothetical protein